MQTRDYLSKEKKKDPNQQAHIPRKCLILTPQGQVNNAIII